MQVSFQDRSQLLMQLFEECSNKSSEVILVSKEGIEVPINLYILNFYSKMISNIPGEKSKILLEEDAETLYLLKDLLTRGDGRFEGNQRSSFQRLLSAAKSLDINLTENFSFQESNMTMGSFISEIDSLMNKNYTIDQGKDDSYNMSTEVFIDKIDEIFTSTLKKDVLDEMLIASNIAVIDSSDVSTIDRISNTIGIEPDLTSSLNTSGNSFVSQDGKDYCCKHCDKTFKSKSKLVKHSLCHTNHRCSICGKGFRITSLLARHLKVDHGIQAGCNVCGKSFENESILRKHKIMKHASASSFMEKAKFQLKLSVEM